MDAIINERVLDIGFRADLERKQGFCRRHVAELVPTDRRETGGILGSSMLLSAVIDRRIASSATASGRAAVGSASGSTLARTRPPCIACTQGETAVQTAIARFAERSVDPAWADTLGDAAFCLDDFLLLWDRAGSQTASSSRWRVVSSPGSRTCAGGSTATPTTRATTGSS